MYDHVLIAFSKEEFLQISPPKITRLPSNFFLMNSKQPLILRPKLTTTETQQLLTFLSKQINKKYDLFQAFRVITQISSQRFFFNQNKFDPKTAKLLLETRLDSGKTCNICADLILFSLCFVAKT